MCDGFMKGVLKLAKEALKRSYAPLPVLDVK